MSNSSDSSDFGCLFIIMFILVCLVRCDQVKEEKFDRKTQEIENMIEYTQKEVRDVRDELIKMRSERDSLLLYIKENKNK